MSAVYYALLGANGYYLIDFNGLETLIYTTPYEITKLDFTGLNDFFAEELEIDLQVITDYELHISSNRKEGFILTKAKLKQLGDFKAV